MRFGSQSNSVAPQKGFCPPLWLKFISVFKIHSKIYPLPCFQNTQNFLSVYSFLFFTSCASHPRCLPNYSKTKIIFFVRDVVLRPFFSSSTSFHFFIQFFFPVGQFFPFFQSVLAPESFWRVQRGFKKKLIQFFTNMQFNSKFSFHKKPFFYC